MFQNQATIRTLVFYWNLWKENVVNIFESLGSFHNEEPDKDALYVDFSLNYFGVRKHHVNGNMIYLLVNKDADWVRKWGQKGLHMDGNRLIIDGTELVFAIRSYWQSELLTVGTKVLETLEALRKSKSNGPAFDRSTSLLHIFEVSKFLLGCQYLDLTNFNIKKLQCFLGISLTYFDLVFPLDWRKSVSKDLISLRETDLSVKLLDEIILRYVDFTSWEIGRVMTICLGSKTSAALYEHIINKLEGNPTWKSVIQSIRDDGLEKFDFFHFRNTFIANWRLAGYISPDSFVHLMDRLLFANNSLHQTFYTSRSSFAGWLTYHHAPITPTKLFPDKKHEFPRHLVLFFIEGITKIIYGEKDTISWLQRSHIKETYLPILAMKLVTMLCSIFLKVSECSKLFIRLLPDNRKLFPNKFLSNLLIGKKGQDLILYPEMVAEAFSSIDDPLVIVYSGDVRPNIHAPCGIFVDLSNSREEIMSLLFQRKTTLSVPKDDGCGLIPDHEEITCANTSADANLIVNPVGGRRGELRMKIKDLTKMYKYFKKRIPSTLENEIDVYVVALGIALEDEKFRTGEYISLVHDVFSELKALMDAFDTSRTRSDYDKAMENFSGWPQRNMPKLDDFLKRYGKSQNPEYGQIIVSECSSSSTTEVEQTGDESNGVNTPHAKIKNTERNKAKKGKGKK